LNEKQKEVADQYDIAVESSYRSRGCLQLVTDQGLYMMTPYNGSPLRLACEYELQKKLIEAGFSRVDEVLPNREGGLISYDKYRTPFVLKRSFDGRECSLKEEEEIKKACENLALLHRTFHSLSMETIPNRESPPIPKMLLRKTRELKRIRNYIRKSGRRTDFELTFTSCYEQFYGEGEQALLWAQEQEEDLWRRNYGICHGEYHQHNVLISGDKVDTLNLGQFHYNQQILDFYNIIRKALEKNQYQLRVVEAGVEAYGKILPFSREDYRLLYLLLSFPEKFWKISNQYYNSKKCWMPPKNLEKLQKIMEQEEKRKKFLINFYQKYRIGL
jgi:CotS family spore coat protein